MGLPALQVITVFQFWEIDPVKVNLRRRSILGNLVICVLKAGAAQIDISTGVWPPAYSWHTQLAHFCLDSSQINFLELASTPSGDNSWRNT